MKNLLYAFFMLSFFLFSCGGGGEKSTDQNDEAVKTEQSEAVDEGGELTIKDCNEFLDRYDEWTDEYLKVVESYLKDPANMEVNKRYVELTESLSTWATDWVSYAQCASKEKYAQRFEEIGDKLEKGLEELGLGN